MPEACHAFASVLCFYGRETCGCQETLDNILGRERYFCYLPLAHYPFALEDHFVYHVPEGTTVASLLILSSLSRETINLPQKTD